jgi:hypothetical protein
MNDNIELENLTAKFGNLIDDATSKRDKSSEANNRVKSNSQGYVSLEELPAGEVAAKADEVVGIAE